MISFLVTFKDEMEYMSGLLDQLETIVDKEDEIIFLSDFSEDNTLRVVENFCFRNKHLQTLLITHALNKDFAGHKNYGLSYCTKEWVVQLDADEIMAPNLAKNLHSLLEYNEDVDLFLVPRVNLVDGLTQEDVERWNWRVNESGWVMWPDYQTRIFKNNGEISWKGSVHETLEGYETYSPLPEEEEWSLYHFKDIERQRRQNALYETIQR